jgi:putative endonuclease
MFYVYVLESKEDKSWYIGYSSDLKQRIKDHLSGKGARTTKLKHGWELIYYEAYKNINDAKGREIFLKSGSGRIYVKRQLKNYFNVENI